MDAACFSCRRGRAGVLHGGRLVRQRATCLSHDGQVGDLEGDTLLATDRATEGRALPGVLDAQIEACLDTPDGQRRDGDAPVVQDGEELGVAPSALPQQMISRNTDTLERQRMRVRDVPSELVVRRLDDEARRAGRDRDRADFGVTVLARAGARRHGDQRRDLGARVGDELLRAVNDPMVAVQNGLGPRRAGIRARARLGQPEPGERTAGDQIRQPTILLLGGAELEDRVDAEARLPASRVMPIAWSTRPSSSMATHRLVKSPPAPPYSSGAMRPNSPRSPILWIRSTGKW